MGKRNYKYKNKQENRQFLEEHEFHAEGELDNVYEEVGADFAAEVPVPVRGAGVEYNAETQTTLSNTLGWVGLLFAIASWFVWPVLMGASAAILGFLAYKEGAKGLGRWSIAIGLIALAFNLIIAPFYFAAT